MKARMLAILLVVGTAAAPFQAAEAGALTDALRNKVGTAVFLGKVAKANLGNAVRRGLRNVVCLRQVC